MTPQEIGALRPGNRIEFDTVHLGTEFEFLRQHDHDYWFISTHQHRLDLHRFSTSDLLMWPAKVKRIGIRPTSLKPGDAVRRMLPTPSQWRYVFLRRDKSVRPAVNLFRHHGERPDSGQPPVQISDYDLSRYYQREAW